VDQHSPSQTVLFPDLFEKPIVARFDTDLASSDGGAILLHRKDQQLGLIRRLASVLTDARCSERSRFTAEDILRQRVLAIACGYPDGNDARTLRVDPIMKLCSDRSPALGGALASQPTISRFENSVTRSELAAMQAEMIEVVLRSCNRRYGRGVRRIVIDLDPTDDPTYGQQQLSLFNGHYGCHCYLPMMGFVSFDGHAEQHLVAALLRPGNAAGSLCAKELLEALTRRLRELFPKARIVARLDGAFATPALLDWLDRARRVDYVVNFAKNAVLTEMAEEMMATARAQSEATGETARVFGEVFYQARSWPNARRVVVKAEVTRYEGREPRDNPRFVVTNMRLSPKTVYRLYCGRGDCENRIKEMKIDLQSGRTSCTSFFANQLRLTMTAMAFVLIQELRADATGTSWARATVATIRSGLLKIGATVSESTRRIVLHLPKSFPQVEIFRRLATVT